MSDVGTLPIEVEFIAGCIIIALWLVAFFLTRKESKK